MRAKPTKQTNSMNQQPKPTHSSASEPAISSAFIFSFLSIQGKEGKECRNAEIAVSFVALFIHYPATRSVTRVVPTAKRLEENESEETGWK